MGDLGTSRFIVVVEADKFPLLFSKFIDFFDTTSNLSAQTACTVNSNLIRHNRCDVIIGRDVSLPGLDTAGVAIGNCPIWHVMDNNTASTDNTPSADSDTRYHDCRSTNPCTLPHMYITTQGGLWGNVGKVLDDAFMIHRSPCIENTMRADHYPTLDNRTLHHNCAPTHPDARRYDG